MSSGLQSIFAPNYVALIGASNRPKSIGSIVLKNLLKSGFKGCIMPVNPKNTHVEGVICYPDIASLPFTPDLAIFCIPAEGVNKTLIELAERGTRAAVIISAGFGSSDGEDGLKRKKELLEIITRYGIRVIGPNCIGLLIPPIGLNASFAHMSPTPGQIGFISQSGALVTSIIDWAQSKNIGFSSVVSMGDMLDVECGEVIDYMAQDPNTKAIVLYIEAITNARTFISAARAASTIKPIIVLKSGRSQEGAKAAASHTGALAGADAVYDAVFRRCNLLRVQDLWELFDTIEALARTKDLTGERLCILTNGGGLGVLATDDLMFLGGKLARLEDKTILKLNEVLPKTWSHGNPVDIIGDAPKERYADALRIILDDNNIDAILVLNCPVAVTTGMEAAQAVIDVYKSSTRTPKPPLLAAWLGEESSIAARELFAQNNIPCYPTPASAIRGFKGMVNFYYAQENLIGSNDVKEKFDIETAKNIIYEAAAKGRTWLTEPEAKKVLQAYNIPVTQILEVTTPTEAYNKAKQFKGKMVLKILSPDITHKSDSGGVVLNLKSPEEVKAAATQMLERYKISHPTANIEGFSLQQMVEKTSAHELILGLAEDAVFGPVILFGSGGKAVEMIQDKALAIPPLTPQLAHDIIKRTRIYKLLKGYRDEPPANISAIIQSLVNLSELIVDLHMIKELDINPLLADKDGVIALDARIKISNNVKEQSHLVIAPYPNELRKELSLPEYQKLVLRPVKLKDLTLMDYAVNKMITTYGANFTSVLHDEPHLISTRLTHVDYEKEIVLLCINKSYSEEILGMGYIKKTNANANTTLECIFGIIPSFHEHANILLDYIISYAKSVNATAIFMDLLDPSLEQDYIKAGFKIIQSEKANIKRFTMNIK